MKTEIMKTENLQELRELRIQEKAIKARIETIMDDAKAEALALAPDGGEFTTDGHRFQLQRTEVIDMSDYNRYKGEDAKRWREMKAEQEQLKKQSAALTKKLKSITDAFGATHPYWEPDEITLIVKCID